MTYNPFLDPEYLIDYNLKGKDVKFVKRVKKPLPIPEPEPVVKGFSLEELADCYRISGVSLDGKLQKYDLAKELLEKGKNKTQDEWVVYTKKAFGSGGFGVGSAPLYHAIFSTLYNNRDDEKYKAGVEKIRAFLKKVFNSAWLSTLSRVVYTPVGKDYVIHDKGLDSESKPVKEIITGPSGYIKDCPALAPVCNALLGNNNITHINEVYQWISDKDTYLWRLNSKLKKNFEQVVVLGVYYGRGFGFDADNSANGRWPALGVRRAKNFSTRNRGRR